MFHEDIIVMICRDGLMQGMIVPEKSTMLMLIVLDHVLVTGCVNVSLGYRNIDVVWGDDACW